MVATAETTREVLNQLQQTFDRLRSLSKDRLDAHEDLQEVWKYTKELHATLQAIVQLPTQYTDIISDSERERIKEEHTSVMQSVKRMQRDIGAVSSTNNAVVAPSRRMQQLQQKNAAFPMDTNATTLENVNTTKNTNTTRDTTSNAFPTTHPTLKASTTQTPPHPASPHPQHEQSLHNEYSDDNTHDMLMSMDSSSDTNSLLGTTAGPNKESSQTSVVSDPPTIVQLNSTRSRTNKMHPRTDTRARVESKYTLLSLPRHISNASDTGRKQKLTMVRQSGKGRVTPVTLQHNLYTEPSRRLHNRRLKMQRSL